MTDHERRSPCCADEATRYLRSHQKTGAEVETFAEALTLAQADADRLAEALRTLDVFRFHLEARHWDKAREALRLHDAAKEFDHPDLGTFALRQEAERAKPTLPPADLSLMGTEYKAAKEASDDPREQAGWDDPHRLCGDVCIADRIVVGRVPPFVKDSSHPAPDAGMSRIPTTTPTEHSHERHRNADICTLEKALLKADADRLVEALRAHWNARCEEWGDRDSEALRLHDKAAEVVA